MRSCEYRQACTYAHSGWQVRSSQLQLGLSTPLQGLQRVSLQRFALIGSKIFAKKFMARHSLSTRAQSLEHHNLDL